MSGRVRAIASLVPATPAYLLRAGRTFINAITDNGPGDLSLACESAPGVASGFDALAGAIFTSSRMVGAPPANDEIRSCGVVHTSDIAKRVTSLQEGAGGAVSALADVPYDLCVLDPGLERQGLAILDSGSVSFPLGVPTYLWRGGTFAGALADTGVGLVDWTWARGGIDTTQCVTILTPRAVMAASGLTTPHIIHTSDTAKRVAIYQEAARGGSSAPADVDFDFVIIGPLPAQRSPLVELHAICSVVSGVGPTFRRPITTREFAATGVTRTVAGDYDITLGPGFGVDALASAIIANPRIAAAASQNRSIGVVHTSDNVKRVTCLQEGAAGAASALTDFDFDLAIFRRARR